MSARLLAVALGLLGALTLFSPALAQEDPCAEQGPDCRVMKPAEVNALKARLLALRAALPVPDPARWAVPSGVGEAYTMPFVAESNLVATLTCGSWPAGAFTELNSVHFVYDGLAKTDKPTTKPKDIKEAEGVNEALKGLEDWVGGMQAAIGNRIEVLAKLLPHAYLVDNVNGECVDVSDPEAVNIEKTSAFLSWQANEGTLLTMVFGPRTCKEVETERVEKPAKALAHVKSITLEISGPNKAEVVALKQKINRKAFEALLGDVMK